MIYIDVVFKLLICIILGIYTYKLDKLLTIFSLVDTSTEDENKKEKKKKLSYNPANLFNPYDYPVEGDLDPVMPGMKREVNEEDGEEE